MLVHVTYCVFGHLHVCVCVCPWFVHVRQLFVRVRTPERLELLVGPSLRPRLRPLRPRPRLVGPAHALPLGGGDRFALLDPRLGSPVRC